MLRMRSTDPDHVESGHGASEASRARSPAGATSSWAGTRADSRREIRICPDPASTQRRAARLVTVPIAP